MKRLKSKLLAMEPDTSTYAEMYNGSIGIVPPHGEPYGDHDPTYYSGESGYFISGTHKLAQDKPTVEIRIPADTLIPDEFTKTKEGMPLKRLKYFLHQMENDTATYKEMYEGEMILPPGTPGNPGEFAEIQHDAAYWHDDVAMEITQTHKLAQDKPTVTLRIPADRIGADTYTAAAADYCLRAFAPYIDALNAELYNRSRPDNENGKYYLARPGGEVLVRNTAYFALCPQKDYENGSGNTVYLMENPPPPQMCLCIRLQVQLPRRKLRRTVQMLCRDLPDAADQFIAGFDAAALAESLALTEKQAAIRAWLRDSGYCAFVADGSILPREKGTKLPMRNAIPFQSPPDDAIEIAGVRGMGIRRGVTVITGGGYSGKSTLLDAIAAGIYDHCPGDGRELCITDESAVSVSAEDGRAVRRVNISPFIRWIPGGDTADFSTDHASGSTSQAANIMEAADAGARLLLIDEDRSATNFMIRDRMMKELIEREPITPFTDRVGELSRRGVSTILVIGGSGEYLVVADRVYRMDEYRISDVTAQSRQICGKYGVRTDPPEAADWTQHHRMPGENYSSYPAGSGSERLAVSEMGFIFIGDERIDIRALHDIVSDGQLMALGFILRRLAVTRKAGDGDLRARLDALYEQIAAEGLDIVWSSYFTTCERFLDLPRKAEVLAAVRRMRGNTVSPRTE